MRLAAYPNSGDSDTVTLKREDVDSPQIEFRRTGGRNKVIRYEVAHVGAVGKSYLNGKELEDCKFVKLSHNDIIEVASRKFRFNTLVYFTYRLFFILCIYMSIYPSVRFSLYSGIPIAIN